MHYHFISIGGSVMHQLALLLRQQGHTVTGSDDILHDPAKSRLEQAGLAPAALGWFPERLTPAVDVAVLGMHAQNDNPELLRAQELGLAVKSFPDLVREFSAHQQRVVVAGSHGKTTVTSMILHATQKAGMDFDYLLGAAPAPGVDNLRLGSAQAYAVLLEGDEYPSSPLDPRPKALTYDPHILVLTGLAWDHINVYPTEAEYHQAFEQLLHKLCKAGMVVWNKNDKQIRELVRQYVRDEYHFSYPFLPLHYRIRKGKMVIRHAGKAYPMRIYGAHNAINLSAAHQTCQLFDISTEEFLQSMADYENPSMRLQSILHSPAGEVIRDFAHAPSKVVASLDAVTAKHRHTNLIAVLELHTYSSLNKHYLKQYRNTLRKAAHKLVLVDPKALEKKGLPPITQKELRAAFHEKDLLLVENREQLVGCIRQRLKEHDNLVLLMSSGALDGLNPNELGL